jgi:hypothetical protein
MMYSRIESLLALDPTDTNRSENQMPSPKPASPLSAHHPHSNPQDSSSDRFMAAKALTFAASSSSRAIFNGSISDQLLVKAEFTLLTITDISWPITS